MIYLSECLLLWCCGVTVTRFSLKLSLRILNLTILCHYFCKIGNSVIKLCLGTNITVSKENLYS